MMSAKQVIIALVWLLMAPSGFCQAPQTPSREEMGSGLCRPHVIKDEATMVYCGFITDEFEKFITENANSSIRKLVITSTGGDASVAMRMSDLLNSMDIEVVVRDVCASGCAHFLFVPANRGSVEPGGLVAFHHTSTALMIMRLREDLPENDKLQKLLPAAAEAEKEFYEAHGIDTALLTDPMRAMRPACIARQIQWMGDRPVANFLASFLWWLPTRADLARYGVKAKGGFWPSTLQEITAISAVLNRYNMQNIAITGPAPGFTLEQLANLPVCNDRHSQSP